MKIAKWKQVIAGAMTAVMLAGSLSDFTANAEAVSGGDAATGEAAQAVSEGDAVTGEAVQEVSGGDAVTGETAEEVLEEAPEEVAGGEQVAVKVSGEALVEGVAEDGTAPVGSEVSVEVTEPGYTLARLTRDEKGNDVYTAVELDYDNRYRFTVQEETEFVIVDPEQADYTVLYGDTRKAKLTGEAGIKLNSLDSSAQGYKEIVLNFTAVKNGSDGTETEKVYYEVKVTAVVGEGEQLPAGSDTAARYYYIPKTADTNTQSKSIQVNAGDVSASTACTYEFSVRMVLVDQSAAVPEENTAVTSPLNVSLEGNTITKRFATKELYYEDKLGFTRKNTRIYTGQQNLLVGAVKYSKNASYIHDLTAVVYDSTGAVCRDITCAFQNDNDELYLSAAYDTTPGKYKVVVYAGIGEEATVDSPQGGTMYQANTTFTLTVEPGIYSIDTDNVTRQAAVNDKNITFSAVPVGYSYDSQQKAKSQKFTYEIMSAVPDTSESGYTVTAPVDKVKNNISVNQSGRVTVKKEYYVDSDSSNNYIAVVIKAADYEGNETTATAVVQIVSTALVPTKIYLTDSNGNYLGTNGSKITADKADGAKVVVLDQNGNNMNQYVTITPNDNAKHNAGVYVSQSSYDGTAQLHVREPASITIKAAAKDGSKKSKTVRLKITSPSVTKGCYWIQNVTSDGFNVGNITTESGLVTYSAPKGAVIQFMQGAEINGKRYYSRSWFDWEYELKGGSLEFDGDYWLITPSAKTAELKVWIQSNPENTWTVKFVNSNWKTNYEAAPALKLIGGKLYTNKYTNADELVYDEESDAYLVPDQQLTYQYAYGSYDSISLARISKTGPSLYISDFDPASRVFKLNAQAGNTLKAGSYKYKLAFYRDGVLMCKPATITVKVNQSTAVKVASAYTLDSAQGSSVELKCTPGEFLPDFETRLLNANVGGKANDFNKYFELAYITDSVTGTEKAVIRFKSEVTAEEKESLRGRSLTGYVRYGYYSGYKHIENTTSKVTIKIK